MFERTGFASLASLRNRGTVTSIIMFELDGDCFHPRQRKIIGRATYIRVWCMCVNMCVCVCVCVVGVCVMCVCVMCGVYVCDVWGVCVCGVYICVCVVCVGDVRVMCV